MDATFGWAGAGHHVDEYLSRQAAGCARLDLDEALLGVCFGQLRCDGDGAALIGGAGAGTWQVSSNAGAIEGGVGMADGDPLAFLAVRTEDLFDDAGLLEAALAFTRELGVGVGGGGAAVLNSNGGAMLSSYSGTSTTGGNMSSGHSNNCTGGGHDAEMVSPASMSPTTTAPPPPLLLTFPNHATSNSDHHPIKRKAVSDDDYDPATANATTATARLPAPFPRPAAGATSISFGSHGGHHVARAAAGGYGELDMEAMAQVKEMVYRAAAMPPVNLGPEAVAAAAAKPRRKNVRVSSDPQTVAARLRRGRVSERLRVLRKLVPGGSKMDTAFMLDEAASYLKFLKSLVHALELQTLGTSTTNNTSTSTGSTASRSQQQYNNYYGSDGGGCNNPSAGFLGFAAGMN